MQPAPAWRVRQAPDAHCLAPFLPSLCCPLSLHRLASSWRGAAAWTTCSSTTPRSRAWAVSGLLACSGVHAWGMHAFSLSMRQLAQGLRSHASPTRPPPRAPPHPATQTPSMAASGARCSSAARCCPRRRSRRRAWCPAAPTAPRWGRTTYFSSPTTGTPPLCPSTSRRVGRGLHRLLSLPGLECCAAAAPPRHATDRSPVLATCPFAHQQAQAHYRDHGQLQYARSMLVLHNLVSGWAVGGTHRVLPPGPAAAFLAGPSSRPAPVPDALSSRLCACSPSACRRTRGGAPQRRWACWISLRRTDRSSSECAGASQERPAPPKLLVTLRRPPSCCCFRCQCSAASPACISLLSAVAACATRRAA